jgi:hypothetical protein
MRDEVVPLSIKFFMDGGYETANFAFVPRVPTDAELQEIGNGYASDDNNESILSNPQYCAETDRNQRWQFENTAVVEGACPVPANSALTEETYTVTEEATCFVTDASDELVVVATANAPSGTSGTVEIGTYDSVVDYINENQADIIASTDDDWDDVITILTDTYPETCEPAFSANCGEPSLDSTEIIALEETGLVITETSLPYADYEEHPSAPASDSPLTYIYPDPTNPPSEDYPFINDYLRVYLVYGVEEKVFERQTNSISNTSCIDSTVPLQFTPLPPNVPQVSQPIWLAYDGALGSAGGQSALQNSDFIVTGGGVDTANGYTDRVHTNARWYQIPFGSEDFIILELTPTTADPPNEPDDICQNTLRLSFFDKCSPTPVTNITGYSTIITDTTLLNDPNKFITLQASDFPSGTAYVALDSPITCDELVRITFGGSTDNTNPVIITIDGINYNVLGNPSSGGTYFFANHGGPANFLFTTYDVISINPPGASSNYIDLRMTCEQAANIVITNPSSSLTASTATQQTYHVLRPYCGALDMFTREALTGFEATWTSITFGKSETYTAECTYTVPVLGDGCEPVPHMYGKFGHWESVERYPCNDELWDSTTRIDGDPLEINPAIFDNLDENDSTEFIANYCNPGLNTDGNYELNNEADFRDKNIRHYKFPCSTTIPFMSANVNNPGPFKNSIIYPIGFSIDNDVIKAFLDIAVDNDLITLEERIKITKYEIFRGDRSVDKSIVAKGLLFDMYRAPDTEAGPAFHSNYPLNCLGNDNYNGKIQHLFGSKANNRFTFHSPDTHFYMPTLPNELKLEGYQFGKAGVYFDEVKDHPTYVILGQASIDLATGLAIAEVLLDAMVQGIAYFLDGSASGTYPGIVIALIIAVVLLALLLGGLFKVGEIRYQWLETFRNLGHPHQFAYYSAAIGHYNYLLPNPQPDDMLRGLVTRTYLVFLNVGVDYLLRYPYEYWAYDNANLNPNLASRTGYAGTGRSGRLVKNAASPYASLKQYLPNQYGNIQSVNWIHTGFCGDLNQDLGCNPIFGGDTYISRFSPKRKFPFFTSNSHGLAPRTPYEYSAYYNLWPTQESNRYYVDYLIDDTDYGYGGFIFPDNLSSYNLDNNPDTSSFYIKPPAKFYLFSYGFPHFLVESVINCNYRYAGVERAENFYPNIGDVIEFTQESNVSIREPNRYYYNFVYSGLTSNYPWRMLPNGYNEELYKGLKDLTNTTVYSKQDNSEGSLTDPWLLYRALDAYTFPKSFGKLIDMDTIESEAILTRFENGVTIFGAVDQIRDRVTPETQSIGQGGIFAGRSVQFNKTDLGYAGTQHKAKVSCKYGHFWPDAKRGQVFHLQPNAKELNEITDGLKKWFKENLPFKIASIPGLTQDAMDNPFIGLGITMGWDDRSNRVFLTKLDYKPINTTIDYQYDDGYDDDGTYNEADQGFYYVDEETKERVNLDLKDTDFFTDCSFTVAYSPETGSWISYYSFLPNYYISYSTYFQTGINYSVDSDEIGLWSHFPFLSSYQVFYGKKYPWTIEFPLVGKYADSVLESIEYWLDVKKYYSKYDYANVYGHGFNKAFIYNEQQNSGQLNLVHQKDNDLSQSLAYPQFNSDSVDILQSEINSKWSFNYLYNLIRNERGGLPIWLYDCSQVNKELDSRLLDYQSTYKDRLRGDYFLLRLQQDEESRFKMIFRFNTDERNYYQS